jgi:uncharacterized membrane-anchored protein
LAFAAGYLLFGSTYFFSFRQLVIFCRREVVFVSVIWGVFVRVGDSGEVGLDERSVWEVDVEELLELSEEGRPRARRIRVLRAIVLTECEDEARSWIEVFELEACNPRLNRVASGDNCMKFSTLQ